MTSDQAIRVLVITGLSGSGKTTVVHALEDAGYYCVDNLPIGLLPDLVDALTGAEKPVDRFAVVMDVRTGPFLEKYEEVFEGIRQRGIRPEILFLEAATDILLSRYEATRRPHPLTDDRTLVEGIELERQTLAPLKERADRVIDTSLFNIHQIRRHVSLLYGSVGGGRRKLQIELISFGYAKGLPAGVETVVDVRFLPNPHYNPELRDLDGTDPAVREAICSDAESLEILSRLFDCLEAMILYYEREDRAYFKLGVGCTGGRHRSVGVVTLLDRRLRDLGYSPRVLHREILA